MACVPLTSLMNTIQFEFLQSRAAVILDEDTAHMISCLYENLGFLLAFLDELVKKPAGIDEATIEDLEAKIRDLAFLAEDEVESNLAKIYMETADKDAEMILFQNLQQQEVGEEDAALFQNLRHVAEETQNLVNRIKSQYYDSAVQKLPKVHTLSLNNNNNNVGSDQESIWLGGSSHERISKIEDTMVGRRIELNTIMGQLIRGDTERKVIPILGMGGIGKTTLAKRVYEDPLVVSHFDLRAWITVSQEVNVRRILCNLLSSINRGVNIDGSTDEVAHKLRQFLMGWRYLIVVDDVWETGVWDYLTRCFPESYDGSAILVTTRLKEIADYTTTTTSGANNNLHNLHFLDSKESWDLFCSHIIFLNSKFNTIGRSIVDKCGGLPLAIVVAAGLVSQLSKVDELENIEEEMSCSLVSTDVGEQCSRILSVSYNYLPQHLKACFLYLGVFSADCEIPVKKLVRLWIAEGFVKSSVRDKELEEVAVGYLQDLVSRSLVLIDKLKCDGQIKTCRMHDLLHGLCIREARKVNLLYLEDDVDACRWLSLRSPNPKNYDIIRNNYKNARSVLCLHTDDEMAMVNHPKPVRFSLLRVLDLTSPMYTKGVYVSFPDLSDLVLLKYLAWSLGSEGLEIILSKNQKLQTLVVSHSAAGWEEDSSLLPSTVWRSPQLRHLEFKKYSFRVEPPSMVKENLQTLYWLSIFHCTKKVFSRIPNINTLGILCTRGSKSHNGTYSLKFLRHLDQLEDLTIESDYPISKHLPPQCIGAFPRTLRKLKLSGTRLPLGDIEAIALLPSLEVLKLKKDSLLGPEWKPTDGGFPRLKFLLLQHTKLERWNEFNDEFPMLERLVLKHCVRLEQIPTAFSNINSLQSIDLKWCHPALLACAKEIKEEQLNYGNDGLVVIDRTPQYTAEISLIDKKRLTLYDL